MTGLALQAELPAQLARPFLHVGNAMARAADVVQALWKQSLSVICHNHMEGGSAMPKTNEELINTAVGYHDRE